MNQTQAITLAAQALDQAIGFLSIAEEQTGSELRRRRLEKMIDHLRGDQKEILSKRWYLEVNP